ncbi:MAG: Asp-tRNA(Asn)/Glu-tRNA(Gln) amidotransferase subunit GatB [bacterium]|nr:Asp-tRNA(Asn)/Glu-tRNA(Gln) amidotransferase subunit GatB [bacterium]
MTQTNPAPAPSSASASKAYAPPLVQGSTGQWEVVIGLEVHAQISSKSKLFSGASTKFGAAPNSQVSFVDAGLPGMLPVINSFCVEQAVKTGLGLAGTVNLTSNFDRKNYFYADLPSGYQISQFAHPIVTGGHLNIELEDGTERSIALERIHMEQDAGKSVHDLHPTKTYIDLNRAGIALMEIVTQPEMHSSEEAAAFVRKMRSLLRCLETCDGNMEEGSMRADVNVSLRRPGEPLGTRAEIKNLNSMRFMIAAIEYEIQRQMEILEDGGTIAQETRLFDTKKGITRSMRSKENAHDYRYFPDPDLPPLILEADWVENIRQSLPELPDAKKKRLMKAYEMSAYDASVLTADTQTAAFFEDALSKSACVQEGSTKAAKLIANWCLSELFALLKKEGLNISQSKISAENLAHLVDFIQKGTISGRIAKDVFPLMWETGHSPSVIIEEKGFKQVSDTGAIEAVIDQVIADNEDKVTEYRSGKDRLFGFFVGQVMKAMRGKGNPQVVNELLKKKL